MSKSQDRLNARIRAIRWWGLAFLVLTLIVWVFAGGWRQLVGGLFIGELGGAYVLLSLTHRNDDMEGTALFASGMIGMFTRIIALVAVIVIAEHWRTYFNPYMALIGYMLGFVFVVAGIYGFAKSRNTDS